MCFQGASMKEGRLGFYLGVVGERLIAVGGRNEARGLSSVEVYCPALDRWFDTAGLPK